MEGRVVEGREMAVATDNPGPGDRGPPAAAGDCDVRHATAPAGGSAAGVGAEDPDNLHQRAVQRLLEQDQQGPGAEGGG